VNIINDNCKTQGLAYIYTDTTCTTLDGDGVADDTDLIDPTTGHPNGISIKMKGKKDSCTAKTPPKDLTLTVNLYCKADALFTTWLDFGKTEDPECDIILNYNSADGCYKVYYGALRAFFAKYRDFWGAALILVGIFLAFFGNGFVSVLFFMISCVATFGASFWLIFWILDRASVVPSEVVGWIIFGCCILLGCIVGYCFFKHRPLGLGLLAAGGGVALGFLLNVTFFVKEDWLYYLVICGCAVVLGVVTYFLQETVIILITSLIGSYAIIRGISLYAGGFPSEMELHNDIQAGTIKWDDFPKIFYAYLGGIVLLTAASAFYQFRVSKKNGDKDPWKKPRH